MPFKLIKPDSEDQIVDRRNCRVFLAGSIDNGKASPWADQVAERLRDLDVSAFNPRRNKWWPDLKARMSEPKFAQQVNWELDNIDEAHVVFFFYEPGSQSPITLQEMGYVIGRSDIPLVVCCPEGFWRKGNVEAMCGRAGVEVHGDLDEAIESLRDFIKGNWE